MKRWKKNLLVLALLSFAVIFANVTPKYHTVSAASKTTLNYKKKTLSKGQTLKLKVKGTKKKVKWSSSKKKVVSVTLASGKTIKAEDLIADAEAQFGKDVVTEDQIVSVPFIQLYDDDIYTYTDLVGTKAVEGWLGLNK